MQPIDEDQLIDAYQAFQCNLQKHFFVREPGIFAFYEPDKVDESYTLFMDLAQQH